MDRKIILVTGSNKGIGFEIVRQLCTLGHDVILTARDQQKGLDAIAKLKSENLSAHFMEMDITSEHSIQQAFSTIKSNFRKLDVLINNAAILFKQDHSLLRNDFSIR